MKLKVLFLAMVSAFVLTACDDKKPEAPAPQPTPTEQVAPAEQTAPAEQAAPTEQVVEQVEQVVEVAPVEAAPAVTTSTGVAACDNYLDKIISCYGNMPEATRAAMLEGVEQMRAGWAQIPDKGMLEQACTQALEAARQANPTCQF